MSEAEQLTLPGIEKGEEWPIVTLGRPAPKIVCYGFSGVGKTWFASTLPLPMRVIAADAPANLAAYFRHGEARPYHSDRFDKNTVTLHRKGRNIEVLDPIEAVDIGPSKMYRGEMRPAVRIEYYTEVDPNDATAGQKFIGRIHELKDNQFQSVVVDSYTWLERAIVEYHSLAFPRTQLNPKQGAKGSTIRDDFKSRNPAAQTIMDFVRRCVGWRNTIVCLVCHTGKEREEYAEGEVVGISTIGQLATRIQTLFSDCYFMFKEPGDALGDPWKYWLATQGSEHFTGKCSIYPPPPARCEPSWEALWGPRG